MSSSQGCWRASRWQRVQASRGPGPQRMPGSFNPCIPDAKPASVLTSSVVCVFPPQLPGCAEPRGQIVGAALLLGLAYLVIVCLGTVLSDTSFKGP